MFRVGMACSNTESSYREHLYWHESGGHTTVAYGPNPVLKGPHIVHLQQLRYYLVELNIFSNQVFSGIVTALSALGVVQHRLSLFLRSISPPGKIHLCVLQLCLGFVSVQCIFGVVVWQFQPPYHKACFNVKYLPYSTYIKF